MNILFVARSFPSKGQPRTGFPNYLYRVSLSLIQMGHNPLILAAGKLDTSWTEQGITVRIVQVLDDTVYKSPVVAYAINALHKSYVLNKEIKKITKKMNIDVIQFTSLEGISLLYYGKVPAVLRLSSYTKTYFSTFQTFSPAMVKLMSWFEREASKRCNAVFAPCQNTALAFGRDIGRSVKVIETPFIEDTLQFDNRYVDNYLYGKKYVLFFGTLYAEKGILVISEILERFLGIYPDHYFVFIGDFCTINGERSDKILKKKAGNYAERVIIWRALQHEFLYPVIKQADFVVLPSLMDNMPNACIEAMYFERIVIGTEGASFEQLITHGENGMLCRIGNSEDLLEKMQIAASLSPEQKKQIGKKAKERIDLLKPQYVVKKLVCFYEYVSKKE